MIPLALIGLLTACTASPGDTGEPLEQPQRIAAISPDAAETVAAIGAGDRLVMVPDSQARGTLSNHPEMMAEVDSTIAAHGPADPEHILTVSPDLVIVTPRHDGEADTAELLEASSVEVLTLPNTWQSVEQMLDNITTIGDAIGATEPATRLRADITERLDAIDPVPGPSPSVLVFSNQAGRPMVNAGDGFVLDVLSRAGGADAAAAAGVARTGFADPEQVIQIDPDAILLVDMLGAGAASFRTILDAPGVADLDAVQQERIRLVEGKQVNAMGLGSVPDGLEEIRDWLAEMSGQGSG